MAMVFFCDRCKRREDKTVPNSQKAGIITNYMPENQADLEREACLEACGECYNNFLWWKGEGSEPRDVPIGHEPKITWHGSPGDLATDICFLLTHRHVKMLVEELQTMLVRQPEKFVTENAATGSDAFHPIGTGRS
jgi:hypothetical protein